MNNNFLSKKVLAFISMIVICLMVSLFFWRVSLAEQQIKSNIDERVIGIGSRIANNAIPLVYNIYQKSTERRFTEETASAILDSELSADFVSAIKVYGNFGHLFIGKYKNNQGELILIKEKTVAPDFIAQLKSFRVPVKHNTMTIGNIEVYFSYHNQDSLLNKIIVQELSQILTFTILILLLIYLIRKALIEKKLLKRILNVI